MLRSILRCQYAAFDAGIRQRGQPCQCQKHPLTKTASFSLRNAKSGLPGIPAGCSLNRNPADRNTSRTFCSGFVPLDSTRAMIQLRFVLSNVSATFAV